MGHVPHPRASTTEGCKTRYHLVHWDCGIFPFSPKVFCWEQNIAPNPFPPPPLPSFLPLRCCQPTRKPAAETAAPRLTGGTNKAKLRLPLQLPHRDDSPVPTWPTAQTKQVTELCSPRGPPATEPPSVLLCGAGPAIPSPSFQGDWG